MDNNGYEHDTDPEDKWLKSGWYIIPIFISSLCLCGTCLIFLLWLFNLLP